jgi:hypothetical protein
MPLVIDIKSMFPLARHVLTIMYYEINSAIERLI